MRIYGSSPLYNYVELVFRSRRLFIVSIIVATLITATVAALKAGSYSAEALVLLSGTPMSVGAEQDASTRGSVKYKMNVLNMSLKDPNFIQDAMKVAGLNRNKSQMEFDKFCKEVQKNLRPAYGDNILELSLRWPTPEAADIINAFYDAYSHRVLDQETIMTETQTKFIREQLDDYTKKVKEVEQRIAKFKVKNIDDPMLRDNEAQLVYKQNQMLVRQLADQLDIGQKQLQQVQTMLARTPQTIEGAKQMQAVSQNPLYAKLQEQQTELKANVEALEQKYNDTHPAVRQAKEQLARVEKQLKELSTVNNKPAPAQEVGSKIEPNPVYVQIDTRRSELEMEVDRLRTQLGGAQKAVVSSRLKATLNPEREIQFKWMVDKNDMYEKIRLNLVARLEQAEMDEKKDRALKSQEMSMQVHPEAQQEVLGSKNMIFYAAGPILGLIIAFAFSLFAETMDHTLRTPLDVEKFLNKPVLAVLPRMDAKTAGAARRLAGKTDAPPGLTS